jgi:hypothetical protein
MINAARSEGQAQVVEVPARKVAELLHDQWPAARTKAAA